MSQRFARILYHALLMYAAGVPLALAAEAETTFNGFRDDLTALNLPSGEATRKQIESGLEQNLETAVGYLESQRTLLNLMRRMLVFAQLRLGKITLQNGKLVMSGEDIATYNAMVAESKREVARSDGIVARAEATAATARMPGKMFSGAGP